MSPTNAKTSVATTEALSKETSNLQFTTPGADRQVEAQARKALDTAQAACALRGIALVTSTDDRDRPLYVASRGVLSKRFDSLADVLFWLEELEEVR